MIQKSKETLVREFEEAKTALEAGPEPGAERKKLLRTLLRNTGIVLLVLTVVLIAAGTVIWNVEALRIPVVNFFIEQYEASHTPPVVLEPETRPDEDPAAGTLLEGLIPDGFVCHKYNYYRYNSIMGIFEHPENGSRITLHVSSYDGQIIIDTENAQIETLHLSGYETTIIEKILTSGKLSVSVHLLNSEAGLIYHLSCLGLTKEQVLEIASAMAERIKALPIPDTIPTEHPSRPTEPLVYNEDPAAGTVLEGLIPENYILDSFNRFDDGTWLALFRHTFSESTLRIQAVQDSSEISFDKEYQNVERFLLHGYYGYFTETYIVNCPQQVAMFFHDPDNGLFYKITSDGLSSDIIWDLTYALTERIKNGYIPTGG